MHPEIKQRWVEALRSGRYQQGQNVLRTTENAFCCLGVLCDLVEPLSWKPDVVIFLHHTNDSMPGEHIYEKTGLGETHADALACMNDRGVGFAAIADYIEANL